MDREQKQCPTQRPIRVGAQGNSAMIVQLVYIHIERTAGTSARGLLAEAYGINDVHWLGIDVSPSGLKAALATTNRRVIGGHLRYTDCVNVPGYRLFTSVVRDPVNRAVSLFNYHGSAGSTSHHARKSREANRNRWRALGLNPGSMLRTIEQVPEFRENVSNEQCRKLSGHGSFAAVEEMLCNANFVLGTYDRLEEYNTRMAHLLHWRSLAPVRSNVAETRDYQQRVLAEPGLKEEVLRLNQEDAKLYDFVSSVGTYQHMPDGDILLKHLSAPAVGPTGPLEKKDVMGLALEALESDALVLAEDRIRVPLRITNNGSLPLSCTGESAIEVGYAWLGHLGAIAKSEGIRTPLPGRLFPGECCVVQAKLQQPAGVEPGEYKVRFSLLQGGRRLESLDSAHTLALHVAIKASEQPWAHRG